jgi:hypothetical protein
LLGQGCSGMARLGQLNASPEATSQPLGFMIKTRRQLFECVVAHFT